MKESTRVRENLGGGYAGIHSVEVASEILLQLAKFRQPTSLKTLSDVCQLTPSKVHRYLSSMTKLGLVFHGKKSGNYGLGRNAVTIGLAAQQQNDQISEVIEELPAFVEEVQSHAYLTVWSVAGPTIIKWSRSNDHLIVGLPLGHVLPVSHSASGMVFAALLDSAVTHDLIAKERLAYGDAVNQTEEEFQALLRSVKEKRFFISRGEVESEVTAVAMPVVDWEDNPIAAVGVILSRHSDEQKIMKVLGKLKKFTEQFSIEKPSFFIPETHMEKA